MKPIFLRSLFVILFFFTPLSQAAQFASVIDAMAIKSSATHTNNSWEDTAKIKGVSWKWPYNQSGAHDHTMVGTARVGNDKNPHIGVADITVGGARAFITDIQITVANADPGLRSLGEGKATRIKTSCDSDDATYKAETYRFEKPGHKPLVVSYTASSGSRGSSATYRVAYSSENATRLFSPTCRILP